MHQVHYYVPRVLAAHGLVAGIPQHLGHVSQPSLAGVNICLKMGKPFPNADFQNHELFPKYDA